MDAVETTIEGGSDDNRVFEAKLGVHHETDGFALPHIIGMAMSSLNRICATKWGHGKSSAC